MASRIKVVSLAIQSLVSQIIIFSAVVFILSIIDGLFAFSFNYDNGKSEELVNLKNYCLAYLAIVATPTSFVAAFNKAHFFRRTTITALIIMEVYILYYHHNFFSTASLRHFIILSTSLLITVGIALPLFKITPKTQT